ncbi:GDNF family receptor alpha-1-like [Nothobranchius furzeri]|uniref:GDNF family receptor alpha-1-like n=1 Tax=Nothobranchius furzeri TaxID=105023 RepID=A0A9D2YIB3_NOTFU|nr:GDNF family receptor alpha-1-like [Nothobranchius furzeri]
MILAALYVLLPLLDALCSAEEKLRTGATRLDCVRASEQCLREQACSTKYRTMRQCVAGGKESNFSIVAGLEAKDECRSAMEALKQSPLYNCRCKRGMKKEKNCLRIYWGIYQTLQGNDFLEDSPYEAVNSRLSDIFRLAPIIGKDERTQNPLARLYFSSLSSCSHPACELEATFHRSYSSEAYMCRSVVFVGCFLC